LGCGEGAGGRGGGRREPGWSEEKLDKKS